jgi:hypothetical protein
MRANTKVAVGRASGKSLSLATTLQKSEGIHKVFHELIRAASLWYKEFSQIESFIPYTEGDTLWWSVECDWDSFSFKYKINRLFSVTVHEVSKSSTFVTITIKIPGIDTNACSNYTKVDMVFPFKAHHGEALFIDKMEICLAWDFMVRTGYLPLLHRTRKFKRVEKYFKELKPQDIMNYLGVTRSALPDRKTFIAAVAHLLMGEGDL